MESTWSIPFVPGVQASSWEVNYLFPVYSKDTEDKKVKNLSKAAPLRSSGVTLKASCLCTEHRPVFSKEWSIHVKKNSMI